MPSKRQRIIITVSLIITPFICLLLGVVAWAVSNHQLNDDGADFSKILPYVGFFLGIVGSILGLILGLITEALTRKSKKHSYTLFGYLLPACIAIFYMTYAIFLNS